MILYSGLHWTQLCAMTCIRALRTHTGIVQANPKASRVSTAEATSS